MNDKEILKKAIEKAVKNGYKNLGYLVRRRYETLKEM